MSSFVGIFWKGLMYSVIKIPKSKRFPSILSYVGRFRRLKFLYMVFCCQTFQKNNQKVFQVFCIFHGFHISVFLTQNHFQLPKVLSHHKRSKVSRVVFKYLIEIIFQDLQLSYWVQAKQCILSGLPAPCLVYC